MKFLFLFLLVSNAFAGPGHGHKHSHGHSHGHSKKRSNITKHESIEIGKYHVGRLVRAGKIDKTWDTAKHTLSTKKKFGKQDEWVVTYSNDKGKKGKKLYVFLKLTGEFIAANFTGK